MMLLAVDTSTRVMGLALYDGFKVLREVSWLSKNHHTVELGPAVETALRGVVAEKNELSAIGVATGPGSFTGLRIGMALAKGLAFSKQIPIVGIPTLDILAAAQPVSDILLACVLEAGRSRLAIGWYRSVNGHWMLSGECENLTVQSFIDRIHEPTLVCGEIDEVTRDQLLEMEADVTFPSPAQSLRRPAVLAELAWDRREKGDINDPTTLHPIYLHHGNTIPG